MEQYFPKEYQQKLELLLIDFEKQLKSVKKERRQLKSENTVLKETIESNNFLIQKLNNALNKANIKIKKLESELNQYEEKKKQKKLEKIEKGEDESEEEDMKPIVVQYDPLREEANRDEPSDEKEKDLGERIIEVLSKQQELKKSQANDMDIDPENFGNMSSIMINPHEIEAIYSSNAKHHQTNGQQVH